MAAATTRKDVNFEGPAPRPMDRAHVEIDPEGQIVVDLSRCTCGPRASVRKLMDDGAIPPGLEVESMAATNGNNGSNPVPTGAPSGRSNGAGNAAAEN
jgi:hypothetical protein